MPIPEPIDTSITPDSAEHPANNHAALHETDPTLVAALFTAWSGDPAVIVASTPGAGKTRLVVHLAEELDRRAGLRVAIAAQTLSGPRRVCAGRGARGTRRAARLARLAPALEPGPPREPPGGCRQPGSVARSRGGHHRALVVDERAPVHRRRADRRLFFSPSWRIPRRSPICRRWCGVRPPDTCARQSWPRVPQCAYKPRPGGLEEAERGHRYDPRLLSHYLRGQETYARVERTLVLILGGFRCGLGVFRAQANA
jgi:hypothetical protein